MLLEVVRADCVVSTDHPRQMEGGQKATAAVAIQRLYGPPSPTYADAPVLE